MPFKHGKLKIKLSRSNLLELRKEKSHIATSGTDRGLQSL